MDAKQLEKMMGFAPGELEKAAEAYEKMSGRRVRTIKLGRPSISDEPSVVYRHVWVSLFLMRLTQKAKRHGQTRTERLRELITLDAMIALVTHRTQTCTPASKVDIFRHLWMLVYLFAT